MWSAQMGMIGVELPHMSQGLESLELEASQRQHLVYLLKAFLSPPIPI
jgi:hypothetical protein